MIEHKHLNKWDSNSKQKWGYFGEHVKNRIEYYLQRRIGMGKKNLEVGGGWYLSYPNSTVIDLSLVALHINPAEEKLQFNLEDLSLGKILPYKEDTFDTATMISLWEYLNNPKDVMNELDRVVKPGGEVYIINGQGAGDYECIVGLTESNKIEKILKEWGYKTFRESIPVKNYICNENNTFQSVITTLPKGREKKIRKPFDSKIFLQNYSRHTYRKKVRLMEELIEYPVTKHSIEWLQRIENASNEFYNKTGKIILLFSESIPQSVYMKREGEYEGLTKMTVIDEDEKINSNIRVQKFLREKYDLNFGYTIDYICKYSKKRHIEKCKKMSELNDSILNLMSGIPLNSKTKEFRNILYKILKKNHSCLKEELQKRRARKINFITTNFRQKTKAQELINKKNELMKKTDEIANYNKFNLEKYLKPLQESIYTNNHVPIENVNQFLI